MFVPTTIAFDVETALTDGTPSTEYYRDDFRVISAAFAWYGEEGDLKSLYLEGEEEVGAFLERVKASGAVVVVHNLQFEYGVCLYRFPDFAECVARDTMRLVQVADNGGRQFYEPTFTEDEEPSSYSTGLGLQSAVSRWLDPKWHNHKEPYYAWLRENGVKRGQEGSSLTKLPADMLEAYNVADAKVTLLLHETLTADFERQGYDWKLDHALYKSTAKMVAKAKGVGARVDVEALQRCAAQVQAEIEAIEAEFRARFKPQLEAIEAEAHAAYVNAVKTQKARDKRAAEPPERFNIGSNAQLQRLFVDVLGIQPKFWTKAPMLRPGQERKKEFIPQPSFKAAHLGTYGEGGELLVKRRKRLLVLQQTRALIALAGYDGRWHPDLRACGTATGRMAGGSGK